MTPFARARHFRHPVFAVLAGLLSALSLASVRGAAEEEEDPKSPGVKRRVVVEDDPVIVKPGAPQVPGPVSPPDAQLDELVRAQIELPHPYLQERFRLYVVPFDRITTKGGTGRVRPIPTSRAEPLPPMEVTLLTPDGKPEKTHPVNAAVVRKVEYFEELVLAEANGILALKPHGTGNGPDNWTTTDQLAGAERLMAAALRFHEYARERNIRKGKGWEEIRKPLYDRLREIRLKLLAIVVKAGDPVKLREVSTTLMLAYPKDTQVAGQVAAARVLEARRLLASDKFSDHAKAAELLREFEAQYPGVGGADIQALRGEITRKAVAAFQRAKEKKAVNDLATARDEIAHAAALDDTIPGLREMQRELKAGYQVLAVGVWQYPEKMSPATARLDSEKQVVELLFESLLEEVPDDGVGARYRPGAAQMMPAVVPGGREFRLRVFEKDATGRFGFDAHDVVGTLKLLSARPDTWTGYALPWFDELPKPTDPSTVRVAFKLGHPDPRALFTFKLLPARWLLDAGKGADDGRFAEEPVGTGPYRLYANPKADPNNPREMVFMDNSLYGRLGRDRRNLPYIKEVRLVEMAKLVDPVKAIRDGRLHILPDVPTAEFLQYKLALGILVNDVTVTNNRRVHILAVNVRQPYLQSRELRLGLSMAIDREKILDKVYRSGPVKYHAAMTGPFPPRSWAGKGFGAQPAPLTNRDLADKKLKKYVADPAVRTELVLLHQSDDPRAVAACLEIKQNVESLFKDAPGRKLTIKLEGVPLRVLLERVEDERRYDLAYVPFDYPDDWYPFALGAMLDPLAADRGGRNWTGFLANNTGADKTDADLGLTLNDLRSYREFTQLAAKTAEVNRRFVNTTDGCMPFIPLWQLDRHLLIHKGVRIYVDDTETPADPRVLNPSVLFQGIARWRIEG